MFTTFTDVAVVPIKADSCTALFGAFLQDRISSSLKMNNNTKDNAHISSGQMFHTSEMGT